MAALAKTLARVPPFTRASSAIPSAESPYTTASVQIPAILVPHWVRKKTVPKATNPTTAVFQLASFPSKAKTCEKNVAVSTGVTSTSAKATKATSKKGRTKTERENFFICTTPRCEIVPRVFSKWGRGVAEIKVLESDVLRQVKSLLEIHANKGKVVFRRLNVGAKLRNIRGKIVFTKNRDMEGLPDLLVWVKNGPMMCWEIKSPSGSQSESQEAFEAELQSIGHDYFVIKSLEDAMVILKGCGL